MSALEQATKTCTKCQVKKPVADFARRADAPDGLQWNCRQCTTNRYRGYIDARPVMPNEHVPMSALAPLIDRWARENTISKLVESRGADTGSGWMNRLSELSGVSCRYIASIRSGSKWDRNKFIYHVSFDTADKLTTAMDCNEEWTEGGSLHEFYGPLGVKKYERHLAGVE